MKLLAFTIYDNKALQYHPPFFAATDGAAVRMLRDLVEDPNSNIGRHPADYVLYRCGVYDDIKGHFAAEMPLRHIMDAMALVKIDSTLFGKAAQ